MFQVEGTVPSVVLDVGSHTVKGGIAGGDLPNVLIPSAVTCAMPDSDKMTDADTVLKPPYNAGYTSVTRRQDNVQIGHPFGPDGLVQNWDMLESILSQTLHHELMINPMEYALLFAEPNHNDRHARERLVELLFEKYEIPAVYLARSAVLSAYANGRTTGVVLDIGYSGTSAVPVVEGSILKTKFIRTEVGARTLNEALKRQLDTKKVQLKPIWSFTRKVTKSEDDGLITDSEVTDLDFPIVTKSFREYAMLNVLEEVKASLCRVHDNPTVDLSKVATPQSVYELPDGNAIEMGDEKFEAAERTFFGKLEHVPRKSTSDVRQSFVNQLLNGHREGPNGAQNNTTTESSGLHNLVVDTIALCDQSLHRDMYAGVCLTGGTSDMNGLYERLSFGLMATYHKVRVLAASRSLERKYCAWTGGSILATFSEFQEMWFSRGEYEENGATFVHKKCM